jgi:hypothetical protein
MRHIKLIFCWIKTKSIPRDDLYLGNLFMSCSNNKIRTDKIVYSWKKSKDYDCAVNMKMHFLAKHYNHSIHRCASYSIKISHNFRHATSSEFYNDNKRHNNIDNEYLVCNLFF